MNRFTRAAPYCARATPALLSRGARIRTLSSSFGGCLLYQEHTPNHQAIGQEVRRESNPPFDLHRVACWTATPPTSSTSRSGFRPDQSGCKPDLRSIRERKERESNPQGLAAQPPSNRPPSPDLVALPRSSGQ